MTLIEHYLETRIQIMAGMLDIAAGRLHAAGDDWAAGECEREAQHGRETIGVSSAGTTAPHPRPQNTAGLSVSPAGDPTSR